MQNITFHSNQRLDNIIRQPGIQRTTLTEWMEINKINTEARQLSYIQFPTKWVWNNKDKIWTPRKSGYSIGRTFHVHISLLIEQSIIDQCYHANFRPRYYLNTNI